jgi:hypothetical protein
VAVQPVLRKRAQVCRTSDSNSFVPDRLLVQRPPLLQHSELNGPIVGCSCWPFGHPRFS